MNISAAITKLLPGTLRLSSNNAAAAGSFANIGAGGIVIAQGTVRFAKNPGIDAIAGGTLNISGNNDVGMQDDDVLILENNEQIANAVVVQLAPAGLWNLGGNIETIGAAFNVFVGLANRPHVKNGTLILGTGSSIVSAASGAAGGGANMLFNTPGTLIDSDVTLNLNAANRTFNLAGYNTASQGLSQNILQVDGKITNGTINKATGLGTLFLNNNTNDYGQASSELQMLAVLRNHQ